MRAVVLIDLFPLADCHRIVKITFEPSFCGNMKFSDLIGLHMIVKTGFEFWNTSIQNESVSSENHKTGDTVQPNHVPEPVLCIAPVPQGLRFTRKQNRTG